MLEVAGMHDTSVKLQANSPVFVGSKNTATLRVELIQRLLAWMPVPIVLTYAYERDAWIEGGKLIAVE